MRDLFDCCSNHHHHDHFLCFFLIQFLSPFFALHTHKHADGQCPSCTQTFLCHLLMSAHPPFLLHSTFLDQLFRSSSTVDHVYLPHIGNCPLTLPPFSLFLFIYEFVDTFASAIAVWYPLLHTFSSSFSAIRDYLSPLLVLFLFSHTDPHFLSRILLFFISLHFDNNFQIALISKLVSFSFFDNVDQRGAGLLSIIHVRLSDPSLHRRLSIMFCTPSLRCFQ